MPHSLLINHNYVNLLVFSTSVSSRGALHAGSCQLIPHYAAWWTGGALHILWGLPWSVRAGEGRGVVWMAPLCGVPRLDPQCQAMSQTHLLCVNAWEGRVFIFISF